MSKLSFRARALDAAKPLPVYRNRDLPDLNDCVSINRAVPQMPTGMEKEEELEHHLQRVISAQQVFREKKENMVIPVPEAETNATYYDRLYKGEVRVPKQLIHIQPLGLDQEQPDYDMDSEDETLLNRLNRKMEIKPLQFETMVDRLEKASMHQLVSLSEAKLLLNEDDYLLKAVYDYWVRKRKNCRGPTIIPRVKREKRDGSTNNDAYVAFRRRTEKMQTRKNRKNDEASYEKMLRLRRDFSRTVTILEMIKRREKSKRELLHLTLEVVEKRYQMEDFSGDVLKDMSHPLVEKPVNNITTQKKLQSVGDELTFHLTRPKKNSIRRDRPCPRQKRPGHSPGSYTIYQADIKQYDFHSSEEDDFPPLSPPSLPDEENNPDGVFVFRRRAECHYLSLRTQLEDGDDLPPWRRHCLTELPLRPYWMGLSCRRMGRGGRIILDRASTDLDPLLNQMGSFMHPVVRNKTDNCVHRDQKLPLNSGTTLPSLTDILNNIQNLRRFCFRPRLPQDQREEGSRTTRPRLDDHKLPCLSTDHSCGGITEEQYHSHQQQLIQMHKQQLQNNPDANSLTLQHTAQSTLYVESHPKTLDSASVQFAASAVVSASSVSHQNKTYRTSMNGAHFSGLSRPPYSSMSLSRSWTSYSPQSLHNQRSEVGTISPAYHHTVRPFTPQTSALRLATVSASSLDHMRKVTTTRDSNEPERLLSGLSETTLPMEVT
ncbi:hypothetical protein Q5P01_014237 [Channa striata]|uniref:Enhancer of polycomb homolog n=1 Tax=Channa striata TaxID=64152 RepID=A0AA88MKU6_CHASR|nr:hypothetical protein Q5P01_014237 [Channa striata]